MHKNSLDFNAPLPKSKQVITFQGLYNHKFVNSSLAAIAHKNQIIAAQSRPNVTKNSSVFDFFNQSPQKKRSKTIGSLLPKLKELQAIQRSEKKEKKKQYKQVQPPPQIIPLSKLDVYFSTKNIQKQQQSNLIFLTSAPAGKTLPDKVLNDRFEVFVNKTTSMGNKFLRGIIGSTQTRELNEQEKKQLLVRQKDELKNVVREMISIHHGENLQVQTQASKNKETGQPSPENEQQSRQDDKNKKSSIDWVLKQCVKYDKKFKIKKKPVLKGISKSEAVLQNRQTVSALSTIKD